MPTKQNKGFTLLEILLVIAAIGILAAIVLVAINPNRQLAQARNAQRRSDINTIYKALEQYLIDNGSYPNSVNSNYKDICKTGTEQVGGATDCSGKADLRVLVPTYIAAMPSDPSGGEYRVGINGNNKVAVYTVGENNQLTDINFNDIDANNYIAAIELADGQALELEVKIAITTFIMGLKSDNIWEPIKASVIMAGARTLNGALVPLKGAAPTNFNFVAGDYNRKTGLVGDGSSKYLRTATTSDSIPQDDRHYTCFASNIDSVSGAKTFMSARTSGGAGVDYMDFANLTSLRVAIAGNIFNYGIPLAGFIGASRNTSSEFLVRFNGSTSNTVNNSLPPNNALFTIYARDQGTSGFAAHRLAFYSIGESLDLALLDARVTQLITDYANAIP
jgi:type II secretion system protein G